MQRRLAAILAADVVGYSRLMGVDEMGTLTSLKSHRRELIDSGIAEHRGRISISELAAVPERSTWTTINVPYDPPKFNDFAAMHESGCGTFETCR